MNKYDIPHEDVYIPAQIVTLYTPREPTDCKYLPCRECVYGEEGSVKYGECPFQ